MKRSNQITNFFAPKPKVKRIEIENKTSPGSTIDLDINSNNQVQEIDKGKC